MRKSRRPRACPNGVGRSSRLVGGLHRVHLNTHAHIVFEDSSSLPSAIPAGVVLQVDGEARRADRLRGRQRTLPQADISAAGLLPPLQRRFHRDQEEEVSEGRRPGAAFGWWESAMRLLTNITCSDMSGARVCVCVCVRVWEPRRGLRW